MRKILFALFFITLNTFIAQADNESFIKIHDLLISSENDPDKIQKVLYVLSEEIAKQPDSRDLLRLRVKIYTSIGDINAAYSDVTKLVSLKPNVSSYNYWKCIYEESLGFPQDSCIQCYEKVLKLIAEELGDNKEKDLGYIIVLLMAQNPEGKQLADNFVTTLSNSTFDLYTKNELQNFDRNKFLPTYKAKSQ